MYSAAKDKLAAVVGVHEQKPINSEEHTLHQVTKSSSG